MRIDRIDLLGDFKLNGISPIDGQGIGYSGSSLYWITVTSSGTGTIGPQGSTGPDFTTCAHPSGRIVSKDSTPMGLTSNEQFKICVTGGGVCRAISLGQFSNSRHSTGSSASVIIMSGSQSLVVNSNNSFLISSRCTSIGDVFLTQSVFRSGAISTDCSCLVETSDSVILGGQCHFFKKASCSVILGGNCNLFCGNSDGSAIIGGTNHRIFANSKISSIIGGLSGSISCSNYSSIIGSEQGFILSSTASAIIGGCSNCIDGLGIYNSIIGGFRNHTDNSTCFSSVIGMTNSTNNQSYSSYMDKFHVQEIIKLNPYTNASPADGDLWLDSTLSKLMFRKNGSSYCFECSP